MGSISKLTSKYGKISYVAQIRKKGHPQKCATFKSKVDARRWITLKEAAILDENNFGTAPDSSNHTFGDLVAKYAQDIIPKKGNHGAAQNNHLKWWNQSLGHLLLKDITLSRIAEQRNRLSDERISIGKKRSNATIVRYLSTLSCLFNFAVNELEWIGKSPVTKVSRPKEPRGIVRFLEKDEINRLLDTCTCSKNVYLETVVTIAISTGMRYSEIMGLSWSDIDLENKKIIIHDTKNGERRSVRLSCKSLELVKLINKQAGTDLLFPSLSNLWKLEERKPANIKLEERKPANIKSAWRTALKKAEIDNFRFHDLRHTCASYLAMNGASHLEIAEILGHKSLNMVKRYAHLCESHTSKILDEMNEKIFV